MEDVYSERCQTSKMDLFAKTYILDVWQSSEYASGRDFNLVLTNKNLFEFEKPYQ